MSLDKKKKFSFFDLSDDESFGTLNTEPKNEEATIEEQSKVEQVQIKQPEPQVQTQPTKVVIQPTIQTVQTVKQPEPVEIKEEKQDSFYGKVDPYIPTPKYEESQIENNQEIVEEIKVEKEEHTEVKKPEPVQVKSEIPPFRPNESANHHPTTLQEQPRTNISDASLNGLFDVKEKLDVKTNIYIKKWIYDEIEQIHKRTNISRSSVINKLLEHALKELK